MASALLSKRLLKRVIGASRLMRLLRAGWLKPIEHNGHGILFAPNDVHAALRMLERRFFQPYQIAVAAVRASELRHGRAYQKKGRPQPQGLDAITLDFSQFNVQG